MASGEKNLMVHILIADTNFYSKIMLQLIAFGKGWNASK